jgi:hypothetical protein
MNIGDVVQRKRTGSTLGVVVGIFDSAEGAEILVRWSDASIFPNPTRERPEWLEVVREAKGRRRG